jgi:hypothetical protein
MSEKTIFAVNVLRSRVGLNSGSFPTGRASRSCVLSGIRAVKKMHNTSTISVFPLILWVTGISKVLTRCFSPT